MYLCSYPVENDTLVSLIFSDKRGSVKVKASELTPKLTDFNQGYWCALQDAVSNGASDTVIQEILRSAGFTYWECYWHIQNSDFQSEKYGRLFVECFAKIQIILIGMVLIIQ